MKTFLIIVGAIVVAFFYATTIPEAERGKPPSERKRKIVLSRKRFIGCVVVVIAAAYALNWAYDEGGMKAFLIIVGAIVVAFPFAWEVPEAHKLKPRSEQARHMVFSRKIFIGCVVVMIAAAYAVNWTYNELTSRPRRVPPREWNDTRPITETKYCLRIFRVIPTPICWTDTD